MPNAKCYMQNATCDMFYANCYFQNAECYNYMCCMPNAEWYVLYAIC